MFGKDKKEEPKKEQSEIDAENAEIKRKTEEKEAKRKQDYVDEKMKLTEKELLVELLWRLDEINSKKLTSIDRELSQIEYNTMKLSELEQQKLVIVLF